MSIINIKRDPDQAALLKAINELGEARICDLQSYVKRPLSYLRIRLNELISRGEILTKEQNSIIYYCSLCIEGAM